MPTTLTNGIQLPDKGSVDWYSSMQSNYNLIDTHLGNTDVHVTAEDKARWDGKQGSLSQAQLDAIAQVATNTSDIATLQSGKADASHTHSSSDITDIGNYATKDYVDNSISGLVDNAPDALNTLNELSAALNDDSNFASTVTSALAAKADSADLATVATSGSYTDLTDKPTINNSTITIQKNGSTVDTFTTNGSNKTISIPVPTKTSDLTNDSNFVVSSSLAAVATSGFYNDLDNKPYIPDKISDLIDDSNFVDTSNPAVSSGITSAKVTDYDTHIADTDIHVTASDKTNWNAVSSKANDSDVVHKSVDETISGTKTFLDVPIPFKSSTAELGVTGGNTKVIFTDKNLLNLAGITFGNYGSSKLSYCRFHIYDKDSNNQEVENFIEFSYVNNNQVAYFRPNKSNFVTLGTVNNRWSKVYADEFYYGSNNVEFSTKFVTTDTNQTISGAKTFSSYTTIYNSDNTANTPNLILQSSKIQLGDTTNSDTQSIVFNAGNSFVAKVESFKDTAGTQNLQNTVRTRDTSNNVISAMYRLRLFNSGFAVLESNNDNTISLGRNNARWKDCQTYLVNGLEPSSLSLPSDRSVRIDISSYFTDTSNGAVNRYTVPANGYVYLNVADVVSMHLLSQTSNNLTHYGDTKARGSVGQLNALLPVRKDDVFACQWYTTATNVTLTNAFFIPCQGNV